MNQASATTPAAAGTLNARQAVMQQTREDLWQIADALKRETEPLEGGVTPALLAEVLNIGETENWPRTMLPSEADAVMFRPGFTKPKDNGKVYRSFLPDDLQDEDEASLRALAQSSKNAFVQARIFEVLWVRFKKFPDANAAIDARLSSAAEGDAEGDWSGLVHNLGRLTTLILRVSANAQFERLVIELDTAAEKLRTCSRPFAFPVLADMVGNTLLMKKAGKTAFTCERGQLWEGWLCEVAKRYRGDHHYGHDALVVLQAWQSRWGRADEASATRRDIITHLQEIAHASDPMLATSLIQKALQIALDFGFADLVEQARLALSRAIKCAIPGFSQVSGTLQLPAELVMQVDELIATSSTPAAAVRQLAVFPGLLEVNREGLEANARAIFKDSPLLALIPSVHYHADGKVTHRADGFEGNLERQVAFQIGTHLVFVELLLRRFLGKTMDQLEPDTLVQALADWPHLPPHRVELLTTASQRFAAHDWVSSGFIVLTVYEAVLRDLLRATGYSALKVEPGGTQVDETLNSMLRSDTARGILGTEHCDLVEYVLCEPQFGWNLRNEVAHGTVRPEALTATRVLLVWTLVIRLTCFVADAGRVGDGEE